MRWSRRALLSLPLLWLGRRAWASSYFLEQITTLATPGEIKRLRRAGVRTTDDLAYRGATPPARQQLAAQTGIEPVRLSWLCAVADLMRLRGIGPDAARVLSAAGCRSLSDLQRAEPRALADAVKKINDKIRLSTNPPRAENLSTWIAQSQSLPTMYQADDPSGEPPPPGATN